MDSCKFQISVTPLSVMALSDEYLTNFHMKPKESGFVIIAHSPDHLSFSLEIRDEYSGISGKTIILASELQDDKGRLFRPIMNSSLIPIGEICIQYLIVKPFVHPSNNFSIIPSKKEELKFLIGHRVNILNSFFIIKKKINLSNKNFKTQKRDWELLKKNILLHLLKIFLLNS